MSNNDELKIVATAGKRKVVVLDDDPTGVQTVHGIYILTTWDKELIREALKKTERVLFILTNTRSYGDAETERINREIINHVLEVAKEEDMIITWISRGDSTLRGHYPLEIDVLSEEISRQTERYYDGHLLIPAFFEAGRYTIGNVHYVKDGEKLIPVHETEFAQDSSFGYSNSDLRQWVEEKTKGRYRASECMTISIDIIRQGLDAVARLLREAHGNIPIIVNAMSYSDLDVVSSALHEVEKEGKIFLFRTAASFVKAYCGISDRELLSGEEMIANNKDHYGGIIIVGSHVQKTTRQLEYLIAHETVVPIEMNVNRILRADERERTMSELNQHVNELLKQGKHVVVYSSREVLTAKGMEQNLEISRMISSCLIRVVQALEVSPMFIIAKGGITSNDVATEGLGIQKAKVLGQALPGIPVWITESESKFPGIPYIVFPGNVGEEHSLRTLVDKIIT